jgi:hypothetical protein
MATQKECMMIKSKVVSKELRMAQAAQAIGAKARRKYRSMLKNADKQLTVDRRTKVERGYDVAVLKGVARAQAGSCIAIITGAGTGSKVKYNPAVIESVTGGALHALYA